MAPPYQKSLPVARSLAAALDEAAAAEEACWTANGDVAPSPPSRHRHALCRITPCAAYDYDADDALSPHPQPLLSPRQGPRAVGPEAVFAAFEPLCVLSARGRLPARRV